MQTKYELINFSSQVSEYYVPIYRKFTIKLFEIILFQAISNRRTTHFNPLELNKN